MKREPSLAVSAAAELSRGAFSYPAKCAALILLVFIFGQVAAWATLGQSEASVTSDELKMKSEHRVQTLQNYKVHELTNANGTIVREYVSPQGSVFGITWQGRTTPDMNQLLGTYVNNLQTAAPAQTKIIPRRGMSVKTNDFVYSNFCHLRRCQGSAYVPSLIPSNVSAEVLR
jgi:hypothetical protein